MYSIAIDCSTYVRGQVGGFEAYLTNLLDGITSAMGKDVKIDLFVREDQTDHFEKYSGKFSIHIIKIDTVLKRIAWQNLIFPVRTADYDVVLYPANFRPIYTRSKAVTVIHDIQYKYFPSYWSKMRLLYREIFIPYSIKHSDHVITISDTVAEELHNCFNANREKISVIYNPIQLNINENLSDEHPEIKRLPKQFFLIPSSLAKHKNIQNLLVAIDSLGRGYKDMPSFIFIGAFSVDEFSYSYSSDKNIVLGYVDYSLRNWLFNNCLAVILPSVYEGFGMPYAEALLIRKPVIASDIPISREILGDNAIYINQPYASNEIEESIRNFIEGGNNYYIDPDRVEELKSRIVPRNVGLQYLNVLKNVIKNSRRFKCII